MFADLFGHGGGNGADDEEDDLIEDVPPPPPAAARRGDRQRHGVAAVQRMRNARLVRSAEKWKAKASVLAQRSVTRFPKHVIDICYGRHQSEDCTQIHIDDDTASLSLNLQHQKHARKTHDYAKCLDYGIASGVTAQADGLAAFIKSPGSSLISVGTMDDASMWVKDPAPTSERERGVRKEGTH